MPVTLETESLYLHSAAVSYADMLAAYYVRNKEFLAPFEPTRDKAFYTPAHQKALLLQDAAMEKCLTGIRFYLFTKKDPAAIIGAVGLSHIVFGNFLSCYLGYRLDLRQVNKGYMTQAVARVVRFAFDDLHLHRIEANIMPRNAPSRRVLEKCGFQAEGLAKQYLRINGVWEDHLHMVRLNGAP